MLVFDTLLYTKKLRDVGVPQPQAEVQAETIKELIANDLATKQDLKELEVALKRDMKELEVALKRDIAEVKRDMKEMEIRMTAETVKLISQAKVDMIKWLMGLFLAQTGVIFTLIKFYLH